MDEKYINANPYCFFVRNEIKAAFGFMSRTIFYSTLLFYKYSAPLVLLPAFVLPALCSLLHANSECILQFEARFEVLQ